MIQDLLSWRPGDHVVFCDMEDGVALLDTERNIYYSLSGIGPFLWQKLVDGADFPVCARRPSRPSRSMPEPPGTT